MLELKNISIALKKDGRELVKDFSFTLQSGDKAVIIGEEGNGKSTLLKYLYAPEQVEAYCDCTGDVVTRCKLAYLPQTMDEAYGDMPLCAFFADMEYYLYTGLLAQMGLSVDFLFSQQRMGDLSGGEKVKAQLARLCMAQPDILLLDEPTNDLDLPTLRWLEGFIVQCRQPVLFISHDETLIERAANVIIHVEQLSGKTRPRISVARCGYGEYLSHRRQNFAHQEQVAQKQREDYNRQMEKWRQIYNRVDHEQRVITRQDPGGARLLKKKMHTVLSMGKRFEREKEGFLDFPQEEAAILTRFAEHITLPAGKTVLDLELDALQAHGRCLARDIRLHVSGKERVGITGVNGVGKSTLLARIWAELKERQDIRAAYMPQHYQDARDFEKTPMQHLVESYAKDQVTKARTYLGSMRFTREEISGKIGSLSGGQKAKLLFLDMVLQEANVLVLDEPTRNFSPLSGPVVRRALRDFGGTIISVSHDRKYLGEVCTAVYELTENGLRSVSELP